MEFERNVGQADPSVEFLSRGAGYTVYLTKSEAFVTLQEAGRTKGREDSSALLEKLEPKRRKRFEAGKLFRGAPRFHQNRKSETIRIGLAAANREVTLESTEELPGKTNYFVGNNPADWRTGISNYRKVKYHEVYPGVDLVFYGNDRNLEFDFIVQPGANPDAIRLKIDGDKNALVAKDGSLSLGRSFGIRRPNVYQIEDGKRRPVSSSFILATNHELGIQVGPYNQYLPLVIDPILSYSTYVGGNGSDYSDGIAVDSFGNAYIVGTATSPNFPISNGYPTSANSNGIAFVAKLDPTGTSLLYSTYIGGSGGESGNGIAIDSSGDVYVTGYTLSSDFPTVNALQTGLLNTNGSVFVARIDTTKSGAASLIYSTYLQGGGNSTNTLGDVGLAIAVDANGKAYVTGQTASDSSQAPFPTTNSAYQSTLVSPNGNAFLTVLDTNQSGASSLVYSTYLGGASAGFGDYGLGVTVDDGGNAFIAGQTTSTSPSPFPTTTSAYQGSLNSGNGNAFVTEIATTESGTQSLVYSTYLGGSSTAGVGDSGSAIALDSTGKVFVAGDTTSTDFPTTTGSFQTQNSSNGRAFVAKMDFTQPGSASLIYSTYIGGTDGSQGEVANGIAVNSAGDVFLAGSTSSTNFPFTSDALQTTINNASWDAFLAELNPTGSDLLFATYWGGSCSSGDLGFGVALDSFGNPYLDGSTCSTDYATYPTNAYQPSLGGTYNGFVAKFNLVTLTSLSPTAGGVGSSINIVGSGFGPAQGTSVVSFNGVPATVTSWGATDIVAVVPTGATTGNVVVTVSGAQSNGLSFSVATQPVISSLSPNSGVPGTMVTINGSGFGATAGAVTFGGTSASISNWTDSYVSAFAPFGVTTGPVTITTAANITSNSVTFTTPVILTGLSTNSAPVGAPLTITGTGFGASQGSSVVSFNGVQATVTSWSPSSISTSVPSGATNGNVVVTISEVNSNGISFTVLSIPVVSGISPSSGQVTTPVTISGSGFGATPGRSSVTFNGVTAPITSWSPSTIGATVPIGATSGNVVVTLDGIASNGSGFTVTVPSLASISVTPTNLSIFPGATRQFSARGVYTDGTSQDVTASSTWSSSDTTIASINASGLVTGIALGQTTIQASIGSISATTSLNVATFASGGTMNSPRYGHTSTVLTDGTVLITGGYKTDAELYDPVTNTFRNAGNPTVTRGADTSTLLNDGTVLIVGGFDLNGALSSAEIYNPATGVFRLTGSLSAPRGSHTATLLNDGTVLIAGGYDSNFNVLGSSEIYNPGTGTFTASGSMVTARVTSTATLLNDGTVLILGGYDNSGTALATTEIFTTASRAFTPGPSLTTPRGNHAATLLNSGTVLVTGGLDNNFSGLSSAEIYDPVAATFTATGSMASSRENHTTTLLNNGQVLVAGGSDGNGTILSSAELYDPTAGTFSSIGDMSVSRFSQAASLLSNGIVLLTGGRSTNGDTIFPLAQADLYQPISFTPAGLVSITLSPTNPTTTVGIATEFVATGTFSDSSTQVLASATWTSSSSNLATVTNDRTNLGHAFAAATGSSTVSACTGSVCGSTTLTVGAAQLTITGVSPPSGSAGTPIVITGTGFGANQAGSTVTFNGTAATVSNWSDTGITATVPAGATSGDVVVSVSGNSSNGVPFTVNSAPIITTLSPSSGSSGTSVTLSGSNFGSTQGGSSVAFNGTSAVPTAWSNTSITTTVPANSSTGNVVVMVSGNASNGVSFTVPSISYTAPQSGPPGMLLTIVGSGFGATQGTGVVSISSTPMSVVTWTDTQIVAAVGAGTTSGTVTLQQGSLTLTGPYFTIDPAFPYNVSPSSLNMVVGQTRALFVTDTGGNLATGLHWMTTNPGIVSLSTDDPPLLTAVAPGSATVYAGPVPILVTVGTSIADGTPIWSLPLGGTSELTIIPAVPSNSGVDVFAIDANGKLSAVTSDGTVAWQTGIAGKFIPDFLGSGYVYLGLRCDDNCNTHQLVKIDPVTHQQGIIHTFSTTLDLAYSHWDYTPDCTGNCLEYNLIPQHPFYSDRLGTESVVPDAAGNLFIQDIDKVVVLNAAGQQVASIPLEMSPITNSMNDQTVNRPPAAGKMIVAGDGNAYLPYIYANDVISFSEAGTWDSNGLTNEDTYLMLLRVSPDGSYAKIQLDRQTYSFDGNTQIGCLYTTPDTLEFDSEYNLGGNTPSALSVITNADAGVAVVAPQPFLCGSAHAKLIYVSGDAVAGQIDLSFPGVFAGTFWPQLQREDGSYIGTIGSTADGLTSPLLNENSTTLASVGSGGIMWKQQFSEPVIPQYVTSDGSITVTSTNDHDGLGTLYTLDQDGTVTAQKIDTGAQFSWTNNWYVDPAGTLSMVTSLPIHPMFTFAAFAGGNQSDNGTSIEGQWYPPLASCTDSGLKPSPPPCPGPKEAMDNALASLRNVLSHPCNSCNSVVFTNTIQSFTGSSGSKIQYLRGNQATYSRFLSQTPLFFDGTKSTLRTDYFECGNPPGAGCQYGSDTISKHMGSDATASSQTPSREGKMVTFFAGSGPAAICSGPANFNSGGANLNAATVFHEAMHGLSGLMDRSLIQPDLMSLFNLNDLESSDELTFLLLNNVLGGGARTCSH